MKIDTILTKKNISLCIFLFINFVFSVKYFSRYLPKYALLIGFIVIFIQLAIWLGRNKIFSTKFISKNLSIIDFSVLGIFLLFSIFLFIKIPVETINLDRWSVISSFWDSFFAGEYPYFAKAHTGNPPGPMPFYFILALPFYLVGELGFFSILGIFIFYILMRYDKVSPQLKTIILLLILSSTAIIWEISTRSNIFTNSTLILFSMVLFFKTKDFNSLDKQIGFGILFGLLLSTRNVFVVCYIIMFLYALKSKKITFKSALIIVLFSCLTFCLTFLPFIIGFFDEFLIMNPFKIQSSQLIPTSWSFAIVFCSLFIFLFCKNQLDVFFFSGIALFFSTTLHFIHYSILTNFQTALFESKADISYFIFCIPFFLYYLVKQDEILQNRSPLLKHS